WNKHCLKFYRLRQTNYWNFQLYANPGLSPVFVDRNRSNSMDKVAVQRKTGILSKKSNGRFYSPIGHHQTWFRQAA
ncbi:MAG: hypothetical protein M1596_02580, partial [Firmicutes bacterium]|nr:hypothetical protein [Bacillota bacterium]